MNALTRTLGVTIVACLLAAGVALPAAAQSEHPGREHPGREHPGHDNDAAEPAVAAKADSGGKTVLTPQKTCPIMGGRASRKLFVDVPGYRIYVCCDGCKDVVKADPEKAVATLLARGEQPQVRSLSAGDILDAELEPGMHPLDAADADKPELKPQATCPIMGGAIDKKLFVDAAGYRIYVCRDGCKDVVKADPKKAVEALLAKGEKPEVRAVVCPKCGEIKGTAKCCKKDAKKCEKCGLNKGSIGCCKDLEPAKKGEEVLLCAKCGEVKGTADCCKKDAVKCKKCGLAKDSPGCCNRDLDRIRRFKSWSDEPELSVGGREPAGVKAH